MIQLHRRFIKGIGASALGPIVTAIIQIVSVPLFIKFWGIQLYGEWLVLSSIPAYFALVDVGFASAAANEMTMHMARGERDETIKVFQSIWLLVTSISIFIAVLSLFAFSIPITKWLNLVLIEDTTAVYIVVILILHTLVCIQCGVMAAGFRCVGDYALGTTIMTLIRILEFIVMSLSVVWVRDPLIVSISYLLTRIVGTLLARYILFRRFPCLEYGYLHATYDTLRRIFRPAVAFIGIPLSNALTLQGMVTLISVILGPTSVVIFSTLRTLSRSLLLGVGVAYNALWPEITAFFGVSDIETVKIYFRKTGQVVLWGILVLATILYFAQDTILQFWTQGKVPPSKLLFFLLLLVTIVTSISYIFSVVLVATNKHKEFAYFSVICSIVVLLISFLMIKWFNLYGAATSILFIEIIIATYAVRKSTKLLDCDLKYILSCVNIFSFRTRSLFSTSNATEI